MDHIAEIVEKSQPDILLVDINLGHSVQEDGLFLTKQLLGRFPKQKNVMLEDLTVSEKQVLRMIAGGHRRKEIAMQLHLSERTVSNHLQHIFEKLQVASSVEAVTKAIQLGYLSPIS